MRNFRLILLILLALMLVWTTCIRVGRAEMTKVKKIYADIQSIDVEKSSLSIEVLKGEKDRQDSFVATGKLMEIPAAKGTLFVHIERDILPLGSGLKTTTEVFYILRLGNKEIRLFVGDVVMISIDFQTGLLCDLVHQ